MIKKVVIYTDGSCKKCSPGDKRGRGGFRCGSSAFVVKEEGSNLAVDFERPLYSEHVCHIQEECTESKSTNNRAEIVGVLSALELVCLNRWNAAEICMDTQYVLDSIERHKVSKKDMLAEVAVPIMFQETVQNAKDQNRKDGEKRKRTRVVRRTRRQPYKNMDLLQPLFDCLDELDKSCVVEFKKVVGHSEDKANEHADMLCGLAADEPDMYATWTIPKPMPVPVPVPVIGPDPVIKNGKDQETVQSTEDQCTTTTTDYDRALSILSAIRVEKAQFPRGRLMIAADRKKEPSRSLSILQVLKQRMTG
jgi:ribonuclease HI